MRGHCLCGACRFECRGPSNWVGHCYCESCRRATASPVTTWFGHPKESVSWSGDIPRSYESSTGQVRTFCGTCGTPLSYESTRYPGEIHLYAALLDTPDLILPTTVYHEDERLPWCPTVVQP